MNNTDINNFKDEMKAFALAMGLEISFSDHMRGVCHDITLIVTQRKNGRVVDQERYFVVTEGPSFPHETAVTLKNRIRLRFTLHDLCMEARYCTPSAREAQRLYQNAIEVFMNYNSEACALSDDVVKYCMNDVVMTKSLYDYGKIKTVYSEPRIENVIFNNPATIVFWSDGTKTVVKAQNDEAYDREKGLAMAIVKKTFGNKGNYFNQIKKWTEIKY